MSQYLSSGIDQVRHDLAMAKLAQSMFGGSSQARIDQLQARLDHLLAEDAQEVLDSLATHRKWAEDHKPAKAKARLLEPLGADEHLGTGKNWGYAMDGVWRTRKI